MQKRKLIFLLLIVLIILIVPDLYGKQSFMHYSFDSTKTYIIKTNNGDIYFGDVVSKDSLSLSIKIKNDTSSVYNIQFESIKAITIADSSNIRNGKYWYKNSYYSEYYITSSAYNIKKGDFYYQNTFLLVHSLNYGISDNISVQAGCEPISLFSGLAEGSPLSSYFISPKFGFKINDRLQIGGGLFFASIPLIMVSNNSNHLGAVYGVATYGSNDHNITCGLARAYYDEWLNQFTILNISGTTRLSPHIALVSENWLLLDKQYKGIYTFGIRFFGDNVSFQLAAVNFPSIYDTSLSWFPYFDLFVKL